MKTTPLLRFPGTVRRDPAVEFWLNHQQPDLGALARQWFQAIRGCGTDVREILHDGHPTACIADAGFAYVDTFTGHVNVGFFRGAELADPKRLLEGSGKLMRHVKLRPGVAIDAAALTGLIRAAHADMQQRVKAEAPQ